MTMGFIQRRWYKGDQNILAPIKQIRPELPGVFEIKTGLSQSTVSAITSISSIALARTVISLLLSSLIAFYHAVITTLISRITKALPVATPAAMTLSTMVSLIAFHSCTFKFINTSYAAKKMPEINKCPKENVQFPIGSPIKYWTFNNLCS
jgi:hypothetical protein